MALLLCLICVGLSGCIEVQTEKSRTFFTMDTVCKITLYHGSTKALDGAVQLCNELGELLNSRAAENPIALLNRTGVLNNADENLLAVTEKGLYYSALSDGLFDITMGAVTALWDFKNKAVPTAHSISAAMQTVDYHNLTVDRENRRITLKNGAQLELGAIAKGYIADCVRDFLLQNGVDSALINLGGNVYALGKKGRNAFEIGIQTPFEETVAAVTFVSDKAVVTSGTYQRGFEQNGVYYHHLLNSKTGMPQQNGLQSVTVLANNAVDADALSTLCFLSGKEQALRLLQGIADTEAVFMEEGGMLSVSEGLTVTKTHEIRFVKDEA